MYAIFENLYIQNEVFQAHFQNLFNNAIDILQKKVHEIKLDLDKLKVTAQKVNNEVSASYHILV